MPEVAQEKDQVCALPTTYWSNYSKKASHLKNRNPLLKRPSVFKIVQIKVVGQLDYNYSVSSSDGVQDGVGEDQLGRGPGDQAHVRIQRRPSGLHAQPEPKEIFHSFSRRRLNITSVLLSSNVSVLKIKICFVLWFLIQCFASLPSVELIKKKDNYMYS